jgi:hypothetical protein
MPKAIEKINRPPTLPEKKNEKRDRLVDTY